MGIIPNSRPINTPTAEPIPAPIAVPIGPFIAKFPIPIPTATHTVRTTIPPNVIFFVPGHFCLCGDLEPAARLPPDEDGRRFPHVSHQPSDISAAETFASQLGHFEDDMGTLREVETLTDVLYMSKPVSDLTGK